VRAGSAADIHLARAGIIQLEFGTLTDGFTNRSRAFLQHRLKSWISVQAVLLASCTDFRPVVCHAFHFPRLLVSIFSLMWRYLFVLVDEALRLMRRRRRSTISDRPGLKPGGSLGWRARHRRLAGSLFLRRSSARSDLHGDGRQRL
jgi:cobalt/nickel transport system permease protein